MLIYRPRYSAAIKVTRRSGINIPFRRFAVVRHVCATNYDLRPNLMKLIEEVASTHHDAPAVTKAIEGAHVVGGGPNGKEFQ